MMNSPLRFLPAIVTLAAVMTISGCQKETETTESTNTTETQSTSTETTTSQANTTSVDTNADVSTDIQVNDAPLTILALGDSLTEGLGVDKDDNYPAQLEDRLQAMGYENTEVSSNVPIKNPVHVGITVRIIIPVVSSPIWWGV